MLRRLAQKWAMRKQEHAKQIFAYETERKTRYADPMEVCLLLASDEKYTPEHLRKAKKCDPASMEIVAQAATRAFSVERLDTSTGKGMTIAELVGLVDAFDLWCWHLQKKT